MFKVAPLSLYPGFKGFLKGTLGGCFGALDSLGPDIDPNILLSKLLGPREKHP